MRKRAVIIGLIVTSLILSACSLFSSSDDTIPVGQSHVLGVVNWIDEFPAEGLEIELAGHKVTTGEEGVFSFEDVENGVYTLQVINSDRVIKEVPVTVNADVSDLVVWVGENVYERGSFEEQPLGSLPLPSRNEIWAGSTLHSGNVSAPIEVVDTEARTGVRSVRVDGKTEDGTSTPSSIRQYGEPLTAGARYRLSAWFKADPPVTNVGPEPDYDAPVYMRLRFYVKNSSSNIKIKDDLEKMFHAPAGEYIKENSDSIVRIYPMSHDDEWNLLYAEFTAPENTDRLLMELASDVWDESGENTLWWDDVTLIRVD